MSSVLVGIGVDCINVTEPRTDRALQLCMFQRLRRLAASIKRELSVYRAIARHPRTPRLAKACLLAAIGYFLLPFDLIPDFLPVIGHIDDLIIIPALLGFSLWLVPVDVVTECRASINSGCRGTDFGTTDEHG